MLNKIDLYYFYVSWDDFCSELRDNHLEGGQSN